MFLRKAAFVTLILGLEVAATLPSQCGCGYQDPDTLEVYTDSLIYYFNETDNIDPSIFEVQDFAHKTEQGWNAIYRQGAKPANVKIANDTVSHTRDPRLQVLELRTDPSDEDHLVNGGSVQTVRKDIQYGSFQAALRSAGEWTGGTALSFRLKYNASQSLEMDFMNMDDPSDACVSNLINGEWPSLDLITNFTVMEAAGVQPWTSFTNVRMDWNKTDVSFWIAGNKTRSATTKERSLPLAGQPLELVSWSTGDKTYMEGPPRVNASKSHVAWVRAFFNSSTMTAAGHDSFDMRCGNVSFCLTTDMRLRRSTVYSPASVVKWRQPSMGGKIRQNAGIVAACCSSFGVFALINVFFRRTPWHKLRLATKPTSNATIGQVPCAEKSQSTESLPAVKGFSFSASSSGYSTPVIQTPLPAYGAQTPHSGRQSPAPPYETPERMPPRNGIYRGANVASSVVSLPTMQTFTRRAIPSHIGALPTGSIDEEGLDRIDPVPLPDQSQSPFSDEHAIDNVPEKNLRTENAFSDIHALKNPFDESVATPSSLAVTEKGKHPAVVVAAVEEKSSADVKVKEMPSKPAPTKRIDYLAGLVAVACMGVTLHHFCQTFWPWVADGYGDGAHYPKVEKWLSIFIGSYALTQLWIGPFFLTATRFLSTYYLKNGNLEDIAKKELRRALGYSCPSSSPPCSSISCFPWT